MNKTPISGKRTLNWAHRGASGKAPENTLAAFRLATEMGADGIELDVHLSADGEVVVIHNDTVDATTDRSGRVSQMSLAELQALDAGGWFDPRYAGERIPTLREVFEAVGDRLLINIEIKVEVGYHPLEQESETARLVAEYGMAERVLFSSFSPRSLRRLYRLAPDVGRGFLYGKGEPAFLASLLGRFYAPLTAVHPHFSLVGEKSVAKAHERGLRVNAWTVNDAGDMRHMRDLGVDGIISNHPDLLNRVLSERQET